MSIQDNPLVSIVISVYRRDRYLPLAIQSALDQTWPNVEIIVAEDGGS
ncbi:MAG: glycosyltransferase, partial [bacterium]